MRTAESLALYWKQQYESERQRLAKLWVRYEMVRTELEACRAGQDGTALPAPAAAQPTVAFEAVQPVSEPAPVGTRAPEGPYHHGDYTLHTREVTLNGGRKQRIYYFARKTKRGSTPCALPDGYEVGVNQRTGLPFLRKTGKKAAGAARTQPNGSQAKAAEKKYQPQCMALTADGSQCRNSSRLGSKYCASHKGYRPPSAAAVVALMDTPPGRKGDDDTLPTYRGAASARGQGDLQCAAVTGAGAQCLRHARDNSKYCATHAKYRPRSVAALVKGKDTKPRVKGAADTLPSVRSS